MALRRIISAIFLLLGSLPAMAGWAPFMAAGAGGGGLVQTNWTLMHLGGGGNIGGVVCSTQGVCMARGDVFSSWLLGADNTWHNQATASTMPVTDWAYNPRVNTSSNQVPEGFPNGGPIDLQPCPSSATCAYMYSGIYTYYSNNISLSSPDTMNWCRTGGFTAQNDNSNTVVGAQNPGQYEAIDPYNSSHVVVATQTAGLFESFNADSAWNSGACTGTAATWTSIPTSGSGIPSATGQPVPYHIAFDSTGGTTTRSGHTVAAKVYIFTPGGTAGVYASTDGGATYSHMSGSPTTLKHLKVSGDPAKGGGNVWAIDGSNNVWESISGTWTELLNNGCCSDIAINQNNGDQVAGLGGGATLWASANGSSGSPTFNQYTGTVLAGDTGWVSWAAIGYYNGQLTFNPAVSGQLLAGMGQGIFVTTFPSGAFNWSALSKGIEGTVNQKIAVPFAQAVMVSASDIGGCMFTIATAASTKSTCFPPAQYQGLSQSPGMSVTPDGTTSFANNGGDSAGAGFDNTGYSTDGFNNNYLPLNLWNASVLGSGTTMADNGTGKLRITVGSTTGLKTWAAGDIISSKSIVCVLSPSNIATNTTYAGFVIFNQFCDEITLISGTQFDMPSIDYTSNMSTTGTKYLFYVPAFAKDDIWGFDTVSNVQNDGSGHVQIQLNISQINAGQTFCVSGVTMAGGTTVVNSCWINSSNSLTPGSVYPLGSVWNGGTYSTGGVATGTGAAGGSLAAASLTNITQINTNSYPLCTTDGGSTWTTLHVTGDGYSFGTLGAAAAGATMATITSGSWPGSARVLLASGRWLYITSGSVAGSTLTFSPAVPPGDSITNGTNFLVGTGYSGPYMMDRDWVTANTFFAVNASVGLIKWTNCGTPTIISAESGGAGWLSGANPGGQGVLKTVPGQAGHMFWSAGFVGSATYPGPGSLYRACEGTTSSATMVRVPGFYTPFGFGLGAAAPGQDYAAEYVNGWYDPGDVQNNAQPGIWKSTNDPNAGNTSACVASVSITASITGTVMNVTAVSGAGNIRKGQLVANVGGTAVAANTTIVSLGTGTGGVGTYNVSVSQTVGSESMTTAQTWTNIATSALNAPANIPLGWIGASTQGPSISDLSGDPFIYGPVYAALGYGTAYGVFLP